ncbi:MarR family winged helix-turn-helix transcriptional regulator [Streptomyces sp. cg28]|uniref:MarR family winged helix-turn-helix transcriptional regulator n=1 Tax=unclassified Streptomyces TaxID=2593676 RepID=UPI000DB97F59|nr:MarR family winged helix-turn-helix transcriptional regulator [Streptomyces sp. PsTaAH-137]MYT72828.1 MarR family transcriptional regulator [Streptomyces sp. SID8367]RAJ78804.1 DNA-binding MarR family transcriptional regulator [Streptomyces sp. PsTaAH-137]
MQKTEALALSAALIAAAGDLTQRLHEGVVARGFDGLRPVHGFAFSRLSAGDATTTELAAHLGVTKQAASQLVDEMVRKGYVERRPHPHDARARLLVLTERGRACTRAAEEAAGEAVLPWVERFGEEQVRALTAQLLAIAPGGPVRPIW